MQARGDGADGDRNNDGSNGVTNETSSERLEYLRTEIENERISMSEIAELQGMVDHIDPSDVLLLEWAGVPESQEETEYTVSWSIFTDATSPMEAVDIALGILADPENTAIVWTVRDNFGNEIVIETNREPFEVVAEFHGTGATA